MIQSMTENYRRLELNLKSNTKEFIKIINYVKGRLPNEKAETKEDKIDLDEFSFEVVNMASKVFENKELVLHVTITRKVLPTIYSDYITLKYIFSKILMMCVKGAKNGTIVTLSIRKKRNYSAPISDAPVYEFIYRNGEKNSINDKWKEWLYSIVEDNKGTLTIKEKKNTYTFICLIL